jgi:exopolysaccharide biosynthesis polyprenyl glycosylphosphotransferase
MTLVSDDAPSSLDLDADRRVPAPSRQPRRSWASPEPYLPRPHGDVPDGTRPDRAWRQVAAGYVRQTVVADLALAASVTVVLTAGYGRLAACFGLAGGLAFVALVASLGGYARRSLGVATLEFQASARAAVLLALIVMAFDFTAQVDVPRRLVFVGLPLLILLTWADRHGRRRRLHKARQNGQAMQATLLVGAPHRVARLVEHLDAARHSGFEPVGACLPDPADRADVEALPVLGGLADIVQVVVDSGIEVVVVAASTFSGDGLRRLSWALGRTSTELVVAPDLVEVGGPRLALRPVAGLALLDVEVEAPRRRLLAKSVLDRVLGTVFLLVAAPIVAVAAILVAATSPGGAFFRQTRVGLDGRTFTMWKLRSMGRDAEQARDGLGVLSDRDGLMFKIRRDPRVTPVGRILRRFSIDEFPQLWNVVRGDMSLVGPRPPLLAEVAAYPDPVVRRLHVRPGLTGLWQVSGRADLDWDSSVTLDLRYVDNWSVTMDLMILWKTTRAVLQGHGAY